MGFLVSLCRRLAGWVVSSRSPSPTPSRRHGRRRRYADDYSSNGDMERSPSEWSAKDDEEQASTASSTELAQLGCINCQQMIHSPVGRPGWAKIAKIDSGLLADTETLGSSHSGTIRKGTWVSDQGLETPVAVKIFHRKFNKEMTKQVSRELIKGLLLRHRNLLCPIGFCFKKRQLHLFYEYMVKGSLDQHLFTKESSPDKVLSWYRRYNVIYGVAIGLHHLHSNGSVHGSIKCSNILLDQDMTARLGDFGYSTGLFMVKLSDITYLPPECNPETVVTLDISGPTLEKDVFFFGSVILEVVCGEKTSGRLVDRVWELYEGGNDIVGAVDQTVSAAADFNQDEAEKLLVLALACSHPDPKQRPGMQDVVDILTGNVPLPVVPSRNGGYNAASDDSQDDIDPDQVRDDPEDERDDRVNEWLKHLSAKPPLGKKRQKRRR